jgi:hypothetical protein
MPRTGAAYIFERRGTTWVQEAKLTALDASAGAEFGVSVGISRSTVVVGALFHRPAGAAYVFVHSGSSWVQQAEFTMPALPDLPTEFGSAVAVSGATVVVGMNQPGADGKGYAFVYARTGNTWAPQATLTNSDGNPFDLFGDTLSFSGSTVVVGAYGKNSQTGTLQVGSVYVFIRSGTTWTQQAEIADPTGQVFDHFGFVAISDSILMVGARGGVYLFRREGGAWLQLSIVSGCPPCRWDSIALSDTERVDSARDLRIAVVGATAQQTITGAAYAFRVY